MAIFKCKMCGGALETNEDITVAECEYCGSKQTVPTADSEKKISLFTRANKLRAACDFDKAAGVYESIVAEFSEEAEAYWGLILCNYGIEYVDDPATGKKIPTCHRSSFDSVMDNSDFEMVMENADSVSRKVYREEAKAIEELRKAIIEVSSKEEPYDIFICYKETDENGDRTIDSVIAQDVYTELTDKGYRVFFSRITLEDKLGQEYEPYIFAALNSAKVMLAFGTDYEYYNAVWVKNEWSRFLQLIAKGEKKTLIPCYKNIDAYDMPKEFARLQAQDMGKVGAVQDLLRGIEKIVPKNVPSQVAEKVTVTQSGGPNVEALLKRGNNALEDGNFDEAKTHFSKVLDIDAECAEAYLGLAMAGRGVNTERAFVFKDGLDNKNYIRAKKYADTSLRERLDSLEKEKDEYLVKEAAKLEENKRTLKEHRNRIKSVQNYICATARHTVGLKADGTVIAVGDNGYRQCDVDEWSDIVAVSASFLHTVGLKSDGTVVATDYRGKGSKIYRQRCDVENWKDIVAISAGENFTVGLKSDGRVITTDYNNYGCDENCYIDELKDVVAISAGDDNIIGLKSDGTVIAVPFTETADRMAYKNYVSAWKDIVAVSAGDYDTAGVKSDGTVVLAGMSSVNMGDAEKWTDIVAVSVGYDFIVGLKADGTVVAVGNNEDGQCNVSEWTDIVAVSAGDCFTIGLKSDGTVVATKFIGDEEYYHGQCNADGWKLFDDLDSLEKAKQMAEEKRKKDAAFSEAVSVSKDPEMVRQLLESGCDPNLIIDTTSKKGNHVKLSVLSYAVIESGSIEIAELLLKYGADPNNSVRIVANGDEYSVLSDAIFSVKNAPMVKLLLEAGADPNKIDIITASNGKKCSMPMLSFAIVEAKSAEMVELLLKYGADIKNYVKTNKDGDKYSALSDAIFMAKSATIVELLLKAGADPNKVETIYDEGKNSRLSMLSYAIIMAQSTEIVELLVKYGAHWNNEIKLNGTIKIEKKYPYDKRYKLPSDLIRTLKSNGWKGSLF